MAVETPSPVVLRFGAFELDLRAGELHKQGLRVKLQEQPFRVLNVLLHHPGEVVTREDLRASIWPADTFVDFDNSLNTSINKLREALGDSAESPRFIETLPRRGYRFVAPVTGLQSKRTAGTEARTRPWKFAVPVAALTVALLAGGFYWRSRQAQRLTEKDTIVLADFDNRTGDAVFDDALKQALAVELLQSPFLNVLSDRRVSETLGMMGRPINQRITMDVGRELCQRTGSKALLGGTISSLGSHYLLDLTAVACGAGDILAKEQGEATSKEDVLKALSRASSSLRANLGESLPSVQ
jgi:DNA-binding winged helix-turn-helix (wHTH) protein